jgi:hypothetical protein
MIAPRSRIFGKSAMTIDVREDGTYRGQTLTPEGTRHAAGTWKAAGEEITLVVVTRDGKPVDAPDTKVAVLHEGRLLFEPSETTQPLVMRRK